MQLRRSDEDRVEDNEGGLSATSPVPPVYEEELVRGGEKWAPRPFLELLLRQCALALPLRSRPYEGGKGFDVVP